MSYEGEDRRARPPWFEEFLKRDDERHGELLRRLESIDDRLAAQNGRIGELELGEAELRGMRAARRGARAHTFSLASLIVASMVLAVLVYNSFLK